MLAAWKLWPFRAHGCAASLQGSGQGGGGGSSRRLRQRRLQLPGARCHSGGRASDCHPQRATRSHGDPTAGRAIDMTIDSTTGLTIDVTLGPTISLTIEQLEVSGRLPACSPACLLACLPACLLAFCLPVCFGAQGGQSRQSSVERAA